MRYALLSLSVLALVVACGPKLPYPPEDRVDNAPNFSADYEVADDRVTVEVYTDGFNLDDTWLLTSGNRRVDPYRIDYEKNRSGGFGGVSVGVGHSLGGSAVGGSVGVDSERPGEYNRAFLHFKRDAAGEPPWTLSIKPLGEPRTKILLPIKEEDEK